jgi:hypothetical protein
VRATQFGFSAVIRGDEALVGMTNYFNLSSPSGTGRVAVWTRNPATDVWQRTGTINPPPGQETSAFGEQVALGPSRAVISSIEAADVYVRSGSSWVFEQRIFQGSSPVFAGPIAFDSGRVYLSSGFEGPSQVWVYARQNGSWQRVQVLTAAQPVSGEDFGASFAVTGTTLVVGAPNPIARGAVYVFNLNNGVWVQRQRFVAPDGVGNDRFGDAVAFASGVIAVGAPRAYRDPAPTCGLLGASGAVYVFRLAGTLWSHSQTISHRDAACHLEFGAEVAVTPNHLAARSTFELDYNSVTMLYRRVGTSFQIVGRNRGGGAGFDSMSISPTTLMIGLGERATVHNLSAWPPQ